MHTIDFQKYMSDHDLADADMQTMYRVNTHIHTPYSFSAFNSIREAVEQGAREEIKVLGINDFYTVAGYEEFYHEADGKKIYPLFSIEFTGLDPDFQRNNIRVNDPNNPGRIYLCGKGLSYPVHNKDFLLYLGTLQERNNAHIREMIRKVNGYFDQIGVSIQLDYPSIFQQYARDILRERHIARGIKDSIFSQAGSIKEKVALLEKIFGNVPVESSLTDEAALENEIRNRLLKKDKPAFLAEESSTFYPMHELCEHIRSAGGIPCYPLLLADSVEQCNEFEKDMEEMHRYLSLLGIRCIEFITHRNTLEMITRYTAYFHDRHYLILFGTEHNTPEKSTLRPYCKYNQPLSDRLNHIAWESACVIAAHQFLMKEEGAGYLDEQGLARITQMEEFIKLGRKVINTWIKNN